MGVPPCFWSTRTLLGELSNFSPEQTTECDIRCQLGLVTLCRLRIPVSRYYVRRGRSRLGSDARHSSGGQIYNGCKTEGT